MAQEIENQQPRPERDPLNPEQTPLPANINELRGAIPGLQEAWAAFEGDATRSAALRKLLQQHLQEHPESLDPATGKISAAALQTLLETFHKSGRTFELIATNNRVLAMQHRLKLRVESGANPAEEARKQMAMQQQYEVLWDMRPRIIRQSLHTLDRYLVLRDRYNYPGLQRNEGLEKTVNEHVAQLSKLLQQRTEVGQDPGTLQGVDTAIDQLLVDLPDTTAELYTNFIGRALRRNVELFREGPTTNPQLFPQLDRHRGEMLFEMNALQIFLGNRSIRDMEAALTPDAQRIFLPPGGTFPPFAWNLDMERNEKYIQQRVNTASEGFRRHFDDVLGRRRPGQPAREQPGLLEITWSMTAERWFTEEGRVAALRLCNALALYRGTVRWGVGQGARMPFRTIFGLIPGGAGAFDRLIPPPDSPDEYRAKIMNPTLEVLGLPPGFNFSREAWEKLQKDPIMRERFLKRMQGVATIIEESAKRVRETVTAFEGDLSILATLQTKYDRQALAHATVDEEWLKAHPNVTMADIQALRPQDGPQILAAHVVLFRQMRSHWADYFLSMNMTAERILNDNVEVHLKVEQTLKKAAEEMRGQDAETGSWLFALVCGTLGYIVAAETLGRVGRYGGVTGLAGDVGYIGPRFGNSKWMRRYSPLAIANAPTRPVRGAVGLIRGTARVARASVNAATNVAGGTASVVGEIAQDIRRERFSSRIRRINPVPGAQGAPRFQPAFRELNTIELEVRALSNEATRRALLEELNARRTALITQMAGSNLNLNVAVQNWNQIRGILEAMRQTPNIGKSAVDAIETILTQHPAGQPPASLGRFLEMMHDVGCRNQRVLAARFPEALRLAGVSQEVRALLLDTGALGVRPTPPSAPLQTLPRYPTQSLPSEAPTTPRGRFASMGRNLLRNFRSPLGVLVAAQMVGDIDQAITDQREVARAMGYKERLKKEISAVLAARCQGPNATFRREGENRFISLRSGRAIDISSIERMEPSRILITAGEAAGSTGSVLLNLAILAGAIPMGPGIAVGAMAQTFPRLFPSIVGEFTLGTAEEYENFIKDLPSELYMFIPLPTLLGEQAHVTWGRLRSLGNNLSYGYSVDERGRKVATDQFNFGGRDRMRSARNNLLQASSIPLLQGQPLAQTLLGRGEEYWRNIGAARVEDLDANVETPRQLQQIVEQGIQYSIRRSIFEGYVQSQARIIRHDSAVQELRKILSQDSIRGISDASSAEEIRAAALAVIASGPGFSDSLRAQIESLLTHVRSSQELAEDALSIDFLGRQRFTGLRTTMQQFYEEQNVHTEVLQAGLQGTLPSYDQLPREVTAIGDGYQRDIELLNENMRQQIALENEWEDLLRSRFERDPATQEWILSFEDQTVRARQIGGQWYYRYPEQSGWTWAKRAPEASTPSEWLMRQHIVALASGPRRWTNFRSGHQYLEERQGRLQVTNGAGIYTFDNAQMRFTDNGQWEFQMNNGQPRAYDNVESAYKEMQVQQRTIGRQSERAHDPLALERMQKDGRDTIRIKLEQWIKREGVRMEEVTEDGQAIIRARWSGRGNQRWVIDYAFRNGVWMWRMPAWGQPIEVQDRLSRQSLEEWRLPTGQVPTPFGDGDPRRLALVTHNDILRELNVLNTL